MTGMLCRLCAGRENQLDVSAVTSASDQMSDQSKKSLSSFVVDVPCEFPMLTRTTEMTYKRTFHNKMIDQNGEEIFSGQFVQVKGRPKGRYLLMGIIAENSKKNSKFLVYDVQMDMTSQVYFS